MMMKAVLLLANGKFKVSEVAVPEMQPEECLVRIRATGVCSSDIPRAFDGGAYVYPLIMGHEYSGEVMEIGKNVSSGIKEGERVSVFPLIPCQICEACEREEYALCENYDYYGSRRDGGFAEFSNVKAWNLVRIPEGISIENAALLEPLSVALHAIHRARLTEKSNNYEYRNHEVLILGAGFLGLLLAKILRLKYSRLRITMIDRNEFKAVIAKEIASEVHQLSDSESWERYIKENTARFGTVIEACGVPDLFRYSIDLVQRRGILIWMGNISRDLLLKKSVVSSILRKEIQILGSWNSTYLHEKPSDWTEGLRLMRSGILPEDLVSLRVNLDSLPEAFQKIHAHKMRQENHNITKILLKNN